ncbi:unnamed protein product [Paramecium primaurelia]|uniref:Wntless-like transmembrane domain-containing protein n=1 Tax=Paramecium primaurelia TaxID=5886 RepID=A0A8S1N5T0_PARPR|nr:unnamed protein product [Paramecium primaurelia]
MILFDQYIPLQVDAQSRSQICIKLTFWLIFYITLQVITIRQNKYQQYGFYQQNCNNTSFENQTIQSCDSIGFFSPETNYVFIEVVFSIQDQDLFKLNKTKLSQELIIYNINTHLIFYGNASLLNEVSIKDSSKYENQLIDEKFNLKIQCNLISTHYNCLGEIKEFNLNNQQLILSQITLQKPPQYQSIQIINIQATVENTKYFRFVFIHQVIFILITSYALFNFIYHIHEYNKIKWPHILRWVPYLLILMIFYNLPIQIFRSTHYNVVQGYTNIIQLVVQTSLFYFWLLIFEFQQLQNIKDEEIATNQNKLKLNHLIKFSIVVFYTVPQAILNLYITYQKYTRIQFDIQNEIPYYNSYQYLNLLTLSIYTANYLYLLYKQFNYTQPNTNVEQDNTVEKSYEIFDEQELQRVTRSYLKNYKLLHILSTICFATLLYNQYLNIFQPKMITTINALNEQSAINIYICLILQLYVPAKITNYFLPNEQAQDNRIQSTDQNEAI